MPPQPNPSPEAMVRMLDQMLGPGMPPSKRTLRAFSAPCPWAPPPRPSTWQGPPQPSAGTAVARRARPWRSAASLRSRSRGEPRPRLRGRRCCGRAQWGGPCRGLLQRPRGVCAAAPGRRRHGPEPGQTQRPHTPPRARRGLRGGPRSVRAAAPRRRGHEPEPGQTRRLHAPLHRLLEGPRSVGAVAPVRRGHQGQRAIDGRQVAIQGARRVERLDAAAHGLPHGWQPCRGRPGPCTASPRTGTAPPRPS